MTLEDLQQVIDSQDLEKPFSLEVGSQSIQLNKDTDPTIDKDYLILSTGKAKPFKISALDEISSFLPEEINLQNLDWLPQDILKKLTGLTFSKLELLIIKKTKKLEGIDVVVKLAEQWELIPGIFTFDELNIGFLSFYLTDPQERYTECQIFGTIALGNSGIRLDAKLDSLSSVTARLSDGSEIIYLSRFLNHLLPGADVPTLKVEELTTNLDFGNKTYDMTITVSGSWEIVSIGDNKIELEDIVIDLSYASGKPSSTTGEINALFKIANSDIIVTASNPNAGQGWQFEGSTGTGQAISIGTLIKDIAPKFGVELKLSEALEGLSIENLKVSFNTKTKNFTFTCESKFNIENEPLDLIVNIELTKEDSSYKKNFSGQLTVSTLKFDLIFSQEKDVSSSLAKANTSTTFLAAYRNDSGDTKKVKDLITNIYNALANLIPDSLEINLKNALFAYSKQKIGNKSQSKILFGLNIDVSFDLTKLPLVGKQISPDLNLSIDNLQILVASRDFDQEEITTLNDALPKNVTEFVVPSQSTDAQSSDSQNAESDQQPLLKKGLNLAAKLNLGGSPIVLNLPVVSSSDSPPASQPRTGNAQSEELSLADNTPKSEELSKTDKTKWFKINKSIGPILLSKIGIQYKDAKVEFLLDAAIVTSKFTFALDNLTISYLLAREDKLEYELRGIGLEANTKNLEISGALLRVEKETNGERYDDYVGLAVLKFQLKGKGSKPGKTLGLSAIGSYTYFKDQPALFLYAVLDYPLGGPPFFFVTGLALGLGYNRALKVPPIEKIAEFPLVAQAVGGVSDKEVKKTSELITDQLRQLDEYISVSPGSGFVAIGVKFTSFKMVDCFALLTIAFGETFEINLLGIATLKVPTPIGKTVTPIAEIHMVLRARFAPDEGILAVEAQLDPASYIFSENCRLTGGFAFYSWFSGEHEGDFVITVGGYHPLFKKPDHYPNVPRLGFNWQVDSNIFIKGEAYFALCSHAIMAGGRLEARYESGKAKAWFIAQADFLISWKPYHYDISIYVEVCASYGILGPITVGASLRIWGPEFGGTATIKLGWLLPSFTIEFGDQSSRYPEPIDWETFKASFLPSDKEICSICITDGLSRQIKEDKQEPLFVVNPKQFSLVTNSVIPIKNYDGFEVKDNSKKTTDFGIYSMAVESNDLKTNHCIKVIRKVIRNQKEVNDEVNNKFDFTPISKQVPTGLWGKPPDNGDKNRVLPPDANGDRFVENTLAGFKLVPKNPLEPEATAAICTQKLQSSTIPYKNVYSWEEIVQFQSIPLNHKNDSDPNSKPSQIIRNSIATHDTKKTREKLLEALNFDPTWDVNVSSAIADEFLF